MNTIYEAAKAATETENLHCAVKMLKVYLEKGQEKPENKVEAAMFVMDYADDIIKKIKDILYEMR